MGIDIDVYNRKMDVLNRGFSGYNTDWTLPVFEQASASMQVLHSRLAMSP